MPVLEIEFDTQIHLLEYLPGMHYMHIPPEIVQFFGGTFSKRLVATANNKIQWQCGLMSLHSGHAYITISKARMKTLGLELGDKIHLHLKEDFSKYGIDMCQELEAVLADDTEGAARFEMLKPAMQRYVINYVATVKSTDKRIQRSLLLIGNLKHQPIGKESFREMMGLPPKEE